MSKSFSDLPDWLFDIDEVSAGVYRVIATDRTGHKLVKTGVDPDALIESCRQDAVDAEKRKVEGH